MMRAIIFIFGSLTHRCGVGGALAVLAAAVAARPAPDLKQLVVALRSALQ